MAHPAWETPGSREERCSGAGGALTPGNLEFHLSCGGNAAEIPTHCVSGAEPAPLQTPNAVQDSMSCRRLVTPGTEPQGEQGIRNTRSCLKDPRVPPEPGLRPRRG